MTQSRFLLENFAAIPWGECPPAIPDVLEDAPLFGDMSAEQRRKARAPVRLKPGARDGLHALVTMPAPPNDAEGFILHLDDAGEATAWTVLPPGESGERKDSRVRDFVVDAEGCCYLFERVDGPPGRSINRLRCITRAGGVKWSRTGPVRAGEPDFGGLAGSFERLLMDSASRLYLPAAEQRTFAEIDRENGEPTRSWSLDKFGGDVFMDPSGKVVSIWYCADANRRGLGYFTPAEGKGTFLLGDAELSAWLLYPIGVDASSNLYAWRDGAVARIDADGRIAVLAEFNNIVPGPDEEAIFTSRLADAAEQAPNLRVMRHSAAGPVRRLDLPIPGCLSTGHGEWALVHVDSLGRLHVFGGEAPGRGGTLLVYSSDGILEDSRSPASDLLSLEARLANHRFWQVDAEGRLYLPVTDSRGLTIVRLAAVAAEPARHEQAIEEGP